jgi:DNA-binding LacI/PurR family transcriptional regulator
VDTDFEQCTALAMQHLADLGHRQVGFVNQAGEDGLESRLGPAARAREGVLRVARAVGLAVDVSSCAPSFEAGRGAFAELVRRSPDVTAAVVVNEQALPGMISAANEQGRRIPDDFSILGIALGPQAAAMTVPPTTTVSASGREMGRRAVEVLVGRLEGSVAPPHHELFPGVLTVRGTTAVARHR